MNNVNVLYYHRIYDLKDDINQLCVTPAKFEQQMRYLKKHYNILRFEEVWGEEEGGCIVITFDDGYMDNLQYALPVLEELEIPATIFVSTGTLESGKELWWDELETLILCNDTPDAISIQDEKYGGIWRTDTYELKLNCYYAIHYLMKNFLNAAMRNAWMEQLKKQQRTDKVVRNTHKTLDRQSCIRLAESKYVTIGAHSISHPSLAKLSLEEQRMEIINSKQYLEALLNKTIEIFSYPFGGEGADFNEDTVQICKEAGIKKAAATTSGIWTAQCSNYKIPRNVVRNWGIAEFKDMMDKYWDMPYRKK